ncbi:dihydrofolate reductase family protein [Amnibacterium sp. CER49]|uniref:RibD family protein n=1 Tax=Amnibacterium sp. CER49 TaxID=3039161 RepID=UPI00244D6F76|nr:dihydrofolate reductase family protein [Amnibacterium sp. CER49]MDH2443758.1 dihydrofolate reductase family protein [Amnibacterium sp. CER49]
MTERPYTVLSCCISLDGYLDDATDVRLRLSNDLDFARVDALRAGCDAILVGATTVRRDDPRLLVRASALRAARVAAGRQPSPIRVTVTGTGALDPGARFFTAGDAARVVYCAHAAAGRLGRRLGPLATVVDAGPRPSMDRVVRDLATRGVGRLLVEGGGAVLTQFLADGLADELQLSVAPVLVGDSRAPRFVGDGRFRWAPSSRAVLLDAGAIGDVALLRYALSARCTRAASTAPGGAAVAPLAATAGAPPHPGA